MFLILTLMFGVWKYFSSSDLDSVQDFSALYERVLIAFYNFSSKVSFIHLISKLYTDNVSKPECPARLFIACSILTINFCIPSTFSPFLLACLDFSFYIFLTYQTFLHGAK